MNDQRPVPLRAADPHTTATLSVRTSYFALKFLVLAADTPQAKVDA